MTLLRSLQTTTPPISLPTSPQAASLIGPTPKTELITAEEEEQILEALERELTATTTIVSEEKSVQEILEAFTIFFKCIKSKSQVDKKKHEEELTFYREQIEEAHKKNVDLHHAIKDALVYHYDYGYTEP